MYTKMNGVCVREFFFTLFQALFINGTFVTISSWFSSIISTVKLPKNVSSSSLQVVIASTGCYNKISPSGWFNHQTLFSHSSAGQKAMNKVPINVVSGLVPFLASTQLPCYVLTWPFLSMSKSQQALMSLPLFKINEFCQIRVPPHDLT